jgi:hypothetical protein
MFGYNAQFKRCATDGAKTLRVQRLSATTGVNKPWKVDSCISSRNVLILSVPTIKVKHFHELLSFSKSQKKIFNRYFQKKMISHFSRREKSPNPGFTFHLYTFHKSIGKSVIKGKRP